MKTTGVYQLLQKTYDTLDLSPEFEPSFGRIPKAFHLTIYGDSGHGKTEYAIRFVRHLCELGIKVDWISYEQGHGFDLQQACKRNNMIEVAENFQVTDPHDKKDDVSYFEDFENKIKKRYSCDLFVIDSVQFSDFKVEDFKHLLKKYPKKAFVWISHKDGRHPQGNLAQVIAKLGQMTTLVKNYIAEPVKNRFGGNEKYVVYEQRARLLEPKFFEQRDKAAKKAMKTAEKDTEEEGVIAE